MSAIGPQGSRQAPRFGNAPVKGVTSVLKGLGYQQVRQKGSHAVFQNAAGRSLPPVPMHQGKPVSDGVLRTIADALGIAKQDLEAWAKNLKLFKKAQKSGQLDKSA